MTYFGNKYIPTYCPPDLPWYERDGLLTWYDQNKYAEFSKNPEEYLRNKRVINFHMIIYSVEVTRQNIPKNIIKLLLIM